MFHGHFSLTEPSGHSDHRMFTPEAGSSLRTCVQDPSPALVKLGILHVIPKDFTDLDNKDLGLLVPVCKRPFPNGHLEPCN